MWRQTREVVRLCARTGAKSGLAWCGNGRVLRAIQIGLDAFAVRVAQGAHRRAELQAPVHHFMQADHILTLIDALPGLGDGCHGE